MAQQVPLDKSAVAGELAGDASEAHSLHAVADDLAYQRLAIVNVVFVGTAGSKDWVLIDAGVAGMAGLIQRAADARYGGGAKPRAIVLTHGHFDHVGSLEALVAKWDVPIYTHALEVPYLNGSASYPPPDPTVGGGLMATMAGMYPRGPIDVSRWLKVLPDDGSVPPLPGWRWIHVPGHTPGQVALWRAADRALIAADAFITTAQESAYAVAVQKPEMHGPPMYYTQDWDASRSSVERLAALEPELAITGHGRAMQGREMRAALHQLAKNFDAVAVPKQGKYVTGPTHPQDNSAYPGAKT